MESPYKRKDALDKSVKPLLIKYLCEKFGIKNYQHSDKDQYIIWGLNNSHLSISFDSRVPEQMDILNKSPKRLRGYPQSGTLKIVNNDLLYIPVNSIAHTNYPKITKSHLRSRNTHKDGEGGHFYSYDWEVFLNDNTSIMYHNQEPHMDMERGDYSYEWTIQERAIVKFLETKYSSKK